MDNLDKIVKRRRVPRRSFLRDIGLLVRGQYEVTRSIQVGEGGMLFFADRELKIGQAVVLTFKLPGVAPTVVRGRIRYHLPRSENEPKDKYGVEFENLDFASKRNIRNYVASKLTAEIVAA